MKRKASSTPKLYTSTACVTWIIQGTINHHRQTCLLYSLYSTMVPRNQLRPQQGMTNSSHQCTPTTVISDAQCHTSAWVRAWSPAHSHDRLEVPAALGPCTLGFPWGEWKQGPIHPVHQLQACIATPAQSRLSWLRLRAAHPHIQPPRIGPAKVGEGVGARDA